jgi:hypothetical protein
MTDREIDQLTTQIHAKAQENIATPIGELLYAAYQLITQLRKANK